MSKTKENLLGMLLIFPLFLLIFMILGLIKIIVGFDIFLNIDNDILMLILIHAPIMIGLIIENIVYKDKLRGTFRGLEVLIANLISIMFYYETYFVEHAGWDGLGFYYYWLISLFITYCLSSRFYGKAVGVTKATVFVLLYPVFFGAMFGIIVFLSSLTH